MRLTDPFPLSESGLAPTHAIDWSALAAHIVHTALRMQRNERVIISANAYFGAAMLEALRCELQRANAIELATILHWTPRVAALRAPDGCKPDDGDARAEDAAMRALFACADIFIWLANDTRIPRATHAIGQSEWVLADWPGRSVHFHWFHDPANPDPESAANKVLDTVYQDAILRLDHAALRRSMHALRAAMADREVHLTNPAGTDLRFRVTSRFMVNDGDASREKVADARSARDREEEIPCGALRTIPDIDSVDGVIAFRGGFGFASPGYGLDVNRWYEHGLRFRFSNGRIACVETDGDQAALDRAWAAETGDKDRLGELVLGCNPLLRPVEGSTFAPYYGFGDGIVRLTIGENIESGGRNQSSLHRWLYLLDATISTGDHTLVRDGHICIGE